MRSTEPACPRCGHRGHVYRAVSWFGSTQYRVQMQCLRCTLFWKEEREIRDWPPKPKIFLKRRKVRRRTMANLTIDGQPSVKTGGTE